MGKGPLGNKLFDSFFVGFDDTWNNLQSLHDGIAKGISNYPPYNIKKLDDNVYLVEVAVAGFGSSELEVTIDGGKLTITGTSKDDTDNNYLFKGIANRAFTRSFALADKIEVYGAELVNGMLKVFLEKIVPEQNKPKKIDIKAGDLPKQKQLLQESK
jgi:molecular chaperone IbpA